MQELVEFIVKSLVDKPEDVRVQQIERQATVVIEVRVAPEDLGKVIGRQGRIATAMRTIVKAAGIKSKKRATVEIVS